MKLVPIIVDYYPFQFDAFQQWRSGSVVKTGRRVLQVSIPSSTCRHNHKEFSVVFSESRVNTGKDSLERSHGGHSVYSRRTLVLQLGLKNLQPTNNRFDALKFFLGVRLQGGLSLTSIFPM